MGFEAKKTAWEALEEFLEVKRLDRVGRPMAEEELSEEVVEELVSAPSEE